MLLHTLPQPPLPLQRDTAFIDLVSRLDAAVSASQDTDNTSSDGLTTLSTRCDVRSRHLTKLHIIKAELEALLEVGYATTKSTGADGLDLVSLPRSDPTDVDTDGDAERRRFLTSMQTHVLSSLYPADLTNVNSLFSDDDVGIGKRQDGSIRDDAMSLKLEILRDMLTSRLEARLGSLRSDLPTLRATLATLGQTEDDLADDQLGTLLQSHINAIDSDIASALDSTIPDELITLYATLSDTLTAQTDYLDRVRHDALDKYLSSKLRYGISATGLLSSRVSSSITRLLGTLYRDEARRVLCERHDAIDHTLSQTDAEILDTKAKLEMLQKRRTPAYLRALADYDAVAQDCRDADADIARLESFSQG